MGDRNRVIYFRDPDLVLTDIEIRPGIEPHLCKLINAPLGYQLVLVGWGFGVEPQVGKPSEQKKTSRNQENPQCREEFVSRTRRHFGAPG